MSDGFVLPPVGRLGGRPVDRIFMEAVRYRAKRLRAVVPAGPGKKKRELLPLVELAKSINKGGRRGE